MTRRFALIGLIVAATAATIALQPGSRAEAQDGRRIVIEILNFEFVPEALEIGAGDVVVWKNLDIVPHTVTSSDASWDSGEIAAGGEWEIVVTDEMAHGYYCGFHPSMTATLDTGSEMSTSELTE